MRRRSTRSFASSSQVTPWHAWVVAVVMVLLYAAGAYDFVMLLGPDEDYVVAQGRGEDGLVYFRSYPLLRLLWLVNILAGGIAPLLVIRHARASASLALVATLAQLALMAVTFIFLPRLEALGPATAAFDVGILVVTALFWRYARWLATNRPLPPQPPVPDATRSTTPSWLAGAGCEFRVLSPARSGVGATPVAPRRRQHGCPRRSHWRAPSPTRRGVPSWAHPRASGGGPWRRQRRQFAILVLH